MTEHICLEIECTETANQLALSGEYRQPEWSEKRNAWILIKRKDARKTNIAASVSPDTPTKHSANTETKGKANSKKLPGRTNQK